MGAQQTTTHVANGYKEDIFIKVSADRQYVTLREFGGSVGGSVKGVEVNAELNMKTQYNWEYAMKEGYTRIEKGTYLGFHPDSDRDTVYITIITTKGRVVCHCFPINEDYSVIVNSNGYIRETKYGSIWVEKY